MHTQKTNNIDKETQYVQFIAYGKHSLKLQKSLEHKKQNVMLIIAIYQKIIIIKDYKIEFYFTSAE